MKRYSFAFVPFALFVAACGGDGSASISIVGKPPAEQAEIIADAECDYTAACGDPNFDVQVEGKVVTCTATIEDVDYQACFDEAEPEILADLENCDPALTAADEQTVQDCYNALLARPCITQAELDEICVQIEAGEEPEEEPLPEPCDAAFEILSRCEAPA